MASPRSEDTVQRITYITLAMCMWLCIESILLPPDQGKPRTGAYVDVGNGSSQLKPSNYGGYEVYGESIYGPSCTKPYAL